MEVLIEDIPFLQIHHFEPIVTTQPATALTIRRHKLSPEFLPWNSTTHSRFNMEDFEIESLEAGNTVWRLTTSYKLERKPICAGL